MLEKIREKIMTKKVKEDKEWRERWSDGECRVKKKEVRKMFKKWKKGKREREEYKMVRREFQSSCERKKEKKKEELLEEAKESENTEESIGGD